MQRGTHQGWAGRRNSLLVLFCLLVMASTASAECAWVLWEESISEDTGKRLALEPRDAFASKQECLTGRESKAGTKGVNRVKGTVKDKDGHPIGKPVVMMMSFTCLPDTVDPRGPKKDAR